MADSQPPPQSVADPGNALLSETPAQLTLTIATGPLGQRIVMTIRTSSATLTVFLNGADAKVWAAQLDNTAKQISGGGLIAANGMLPKARGHG
jgi:hypothetical protein